jgi:hypothetical protein
MTAVLRDAYGLTVSTGSRAAVDAYDRGVRARPGFCEHVAGRGAAEGEPSEYRKKGDG